MRLSPDQKDCLKESILAYRPNAQIFIFGSRADDQARGGDIDILILSEEVLNWEEKHNIRMKFFEQFGEQKLDLVCFTPDSDHPFKEVALLTAKPF